MRLLFLTEDKYLYRKAELELSRVATVTKDRSLAYDIAFVDLRYNGTDELQNAITISEGDGDGTVKLPIRRGALIDIVNSKRKTARLTLAEGSKAAILDGNEIKLTAHEYSLLALLISGNGEYIPRKQIAESVWDDAGDGLINIYIHYLREKLETSGEKIIISSRKLGYKINEAYLEVSNADVD